VLLVEDNAINQEVAEELLKSAGLMVEIASDGLQAIAMATQKRFDLVLMDIQMPKLDGIEATRRLRRDNVRARGGNHLPILAMTANIFVDDRRACISAGMDGFVAKPVQPENLFETLIKWLSKTGKSVTEEAPKVSKTGQNAFGNEGPESVLNDIPGLDPAVGLRNLSGDLVGFQRLLRQLADSYSEELETLQADLANRSFETAQQTAHSLKGAAGTLGLVDIQSVAHELESSCRNLEPGDDAEISLEHARGLAHELSRLRKALDALDGKTKPTKDKGRSSPINPAMLARVFADDDEGRNHLLRVFLTQSRKAATVLGAALVHKDVQAISEQAHKLKSAARSVGADRLADCSVAIESATTGPDWEMLRALLEKFDRLVQEIEDHME
jgi:CheY-like chemotaxis protein